MCVCVCIKVFEYIPGECLFDHETCLMNRFLKKKSLRFYLNYVIQVFATFVTLVPNFGTLKANV